MNRVAQNLALLLTFVLAPQPAVAVSIVNGGFEEPPIENQSAEFFPTIPGWTANFGGDIEIQNNVAGSPHGGSQFVELDSTENSGILQSLATLPGQEYRLSFFYSPRPGYPQDTNGIEVFFDGLQVASIAEDGTELADTNWSLFTYVVVASGSNTPLEFRATGISDALGGYVDDVQFVPEPSTFLIAAAAFGLCIVRRRRRAGNDNPNSARKTRGFQRLRTFLAFSVCTAALFGLTAQSARADSAVAWGANFHGQLGDGTTTAHGITMPVIGMDSGVTVVAAGGGYSLAVKNGGAYAWGINSFGELGDGTRTARLTPVPVSGLASGVTAIAAGGFGFANGSHSLAVQNGAAYAWGRGGFGQLGDGTTTSRRLTPVAVIGMDSGVTAVAAGRDHSLAVKGGGLYAWGQNGFGQLGNGTTTSPLTPVAVIGMDSGVTAIAGGNAYSLAIKDGGVYSWGNNSHGQLGHGGSSDGLGHPTPELVAGLESGATAVAAGQLFSLAVVNGSVYAWGGGYIGNTPVQIDPTNLTDIVAVAASQDCCLARALSSDGRLWSLNILSFLPTPQFVFAPTGYKFTSIAHGVNHDVATLAAVPEPSTFLLAAAAFAGLLLPRRAVGSRERRTLIIANHPVESLWVERHLSGLAEMSVD